MTTWDKVAPLLPGLKRSRENEWVSNNPFHPNSNSMAFKVVVAPDGEKGAFFNHAAHAGEPDRGSLYELASLLGVDPPENGKGGSTKRPYNSLDEYAEAHYVSGDVFRKAGWEYVSAKECEYRRPALRWKVKGRWHYRFLDGIKDKPKFLWERLYDENGNPITKAGDGWYGLARAKDIAVRNGFDCIILVNGEASVVVAQHFKIPAASWAGGEEHFTEEAAIELKSVWHGNVWVAYDDDDAGNKGANKALAILRSVGIHALRSQIRLGAHDDMADVCGLFGDRAMEMLRSWIVDDTPLPNGDPPAPPELPPPDLNAIARDLKRLSRGDLDRDAVLNQMRMLVRSVDTAEGEALVVPFSEVSAEVEEQIRIAAESPSELVGLRSLLRDFDRLVGGFDEGVYTIYGATNMGKSQFAITLAAALLTQGPGLIVPTETTPHVWMRRLVAAKNHLNARDLQLGRSNAQQVGLASETLRHYREVEAAFLGGIAPTPDQVAAAFRRGKELYGWEWLIIDSASRMGAPVFDIYPKTVYVFNALQEIAKEFSIPLICTSQVGRDVADRPKAHHEPQLEDGLGGGAIEHNSIGVYGVYDHNYYVSRGLAKDDFNRYPLGTVTIISLKDKVGNTNERIHLSRVNGGGFVDVSGKPVNTAKLSQWAYPEPAKLAEIDA